MVFYGALVVRSIQIFPAVLSLILSRSARAGRTEIGGFLIGKIHDGQLQVTGATFPRQVGTRTRVAINDSDMAILAEELEKIGAGEVIVGWWHTHPGLGAHFMSRIDVATQQRYQAFFTDAVAMVVDPLKFSESLNLTDLDLHVYTVKSGKAKDLDFSYVREPDEIIPDFYSLLLTLDSPDHIVFEETWFEQMLRNVFGSRVTTNEFTETLGSFAENIVAFGTISVLVLFIILSLLALVS